MLHGIELLKVFANLKRVDRMVNEEIKATRSGDSGDAMVARKEALEYARKESRRQEKISRIEANAAAQAQSFRIQQIAQRNAMLAREANEARRSSRSPAGQRSHGSVRVGKSDMEKLNFMEHAEEIKNKFPREVLASQEKQRELDRNLADRWRQYADEDRRYGHDSMNDSMALKLLQVLHIVLTVLFLRVYQNLWNQSILIAIVSNHLILYQ